MSPRNKQLYKLKHWLIQHFSAYVHLDTLWYTAFCINTHTHERKKRRRNDEMPTIWLDIQLFISRLFGRSNRFIMF